MYRNCADPHGQSKQLARLDYQLVSTVLMKVVESLRLHARPLKILDVGCGLGYFTAHMKELFPGAEISGCDISTTAVERAAANAPGCSFFPLDLKGTSLPDRTYDIVVALDVLYYFTEQEIERVVRNLYRLIGVGAYLLIGYHLPKQMSFGRYIRSLEDAKALFEPNGLRFRLTLDVVNDIDTNYAGDPLGRHIYFVAQRETLAPAERSR